MAEINIELPEIFDEIWQPYRYKVFHGGRGSGKCMSPSTVVLMHDGTLREAGAIRVGDLLMGPDSTPRRVVEVHGGRDEMYRVVQNQAMDYEVNSQHLLVLKKSESSKADIAMQANGVPRRPRGRYPEFGDTAVMGVREFAAKSGRFRENFHGFKVGWEMPAAPVTIDPYWLGLWLGDGSKHTTEITTMEPEVGEYIAQYAASIGCTVSVRETGSKAKTHRITKTTGVENPLLADMRALGLIESKHIPSAYLHNSRAVRSQILAGILDSDANVARGCAYLSAHSVEFLRQVKYLADSLGFRTSKSFPEKRCRLKGYDKEYVNYSLTISGRLDRLPFRVARRIEGAKSAPNKDFLKTKLRIKPIGVGEYVGFEVDRDHLFLLADGTVCHNSHAVARYLIVRALQGKHTILCCREFQNSINESCHRLLSNLISDLGLSRYFKITQTNITSMAGSEFVFKGLAQNTEGIKSLEGADFCWVEEAATVSDKSWEILIPTIRKPGSEIIVTFNPDDEKDPTYARFVKNPPPGTLLKQVNWVHNPYMPDVLRAELEHCKATDLDRYNYIWLGVPRSQGKAAVFHGKVRSTHFSSSGVDVFRYGLDFGFGSDPTCGVRCFIRDRILHIDYEAYAYGLELHQMHAFICECLPGVKRNQLWCDASRPETIAYLSQAAAHNDFVPLNAVAAPKWSGSIEDGIAFLNSFDKIDIHPRCKNTLFDFQSYSYKIDKKTDEILPVLVSKYDHGPDAARYSLAPIITRRNSILDVV